MSEREIAREYFVRGGLEAIASDLANSADYGHSVILERTFNEMYASSFPLEAGDIVYVKEGFYEGCMGVFLGLHTDSNEHARVKIKDNVEIIPTEYLILNK